MYKQVASLMPTSNEFNLPAGIITTGYFKYCHSISRQYYGWSLQVKFSISAGTIIIIYFKQAQCISRYHFK